MGKEKLSRLRLRSILSSSWPNKWFQNFPQTFVLKEIPWIALFTSTYKYLWQSWVGMRMRLGAISSAIFILVIVYVDFHVRQIWRHVPRQVQVQTGVVDRLRGDKVDAVVSVTWWGGKASLRKHQHRLWRSGLGWGLGLFHFTFPRGWHRRLNLLQHIVTFIYFFTLGIGLSILKLEDNFCYFLCINCFRKTSPSVKYAVNIYLIVWFANKITNNGNNDNGSTSCHSTALRQKWTKQCQAKNKIHFLRFEFSAWKSCPAHQFFWGWGLDVTVAITVTIN